MAETKNIADITNFESTTRDFEANPNKAFL